MDEMRENLEMSASSKECLYSVVTLQCSFLLRDERLIFEPLFHSVFATHTSLKKKKTYTNAHVKKISLAGAR